MTNLDRHLTRDQVNSKLRREIETLENVNYLFVLIQRLKSGKYPELEEGDTAIYSRLAHDRINELISE